MTTTDDTLEIPATDDAAIEPRAKLELEAHRAEARLLATLEKVDRRRHHVQDEIVRVPHQLFVVAVVAGGVVLGLVAMALLATRRKPAASAPAFIARLEAMHRAWRYPDRVARHVPVEPSLARRLGASALDAAASSVVSYVARRATRVLTTADAE